MLLLNLNISTPIVPLSPTADEYASLPLRRTFFYSHSRPFTLMNLRPSAPQVAMTFTFTRLPLLWFMISSIRREFTVLPPGTSTPGSHVASKSANSFNDTPKISAAIPCSQHVVSNSYTTGHDKPQILMISHIHKSTSLTFPWSSRKTTLTFTGFRRVADTCNRLFAILQHLLRILFPAHYVRKVPRFWVIMMMCDL